MSDDIYSNPRCRACGNVTWQRSEKSVGYIYFCPKCHKLWRITQDQHGDTITVRYEEVDE